MYSQKLRSFLLPLFLFLSLCTTPVLLAHTLLDEFQKAAVGDYVVFAHDKQLTLFRIAYKDDKKLAIEEVTAELSAGLLHQQNWQNWLLADAGDKTGWIITAFDVNNGKQLACYSYTSSEWMNQDASFSFFPTLLSLELKPVEESKRKRIGVEPLPGDPDERKLWSPKIILEGKEMQTADAARVFEVQWPQDASELSGKQISLYFPKETKNQQALPYFPYWVEIQGKIGKVKLRVIDSGKNLTSPKPFMVAPETTKSQKTSFNTSR